MAYGFPVQGSWGSWNSGFGFRGLTFRGLGVSGLGFGCRGYGFGGLRWWCGVFLIRGACLLGASRISVQEALCR